MERIPLYLTASRTARLWELPIAQAHAIVHEAVHALAWQHQLWIGAASLSGLLISFGVVDVPPGLAVASAGWLVLRAIGVALMGAGMLLPRLLVRRVIMARADAAAVRDAHGETTRQRAAALESQT